MTGNHFQEEYTNLVECMKYEFGVQNFADIRKYDFDGLLLILAMSCLKLCLV